MRIFGSQRRNGLPLVPERPWKSSILKKVIKTSTRVTLVIHIQMEAKGVVKRTKNSLTKRQKITLAGVSAGVVSLALIVLIACLWPKVEKQKQSVSEVKDTGKNSSEASRRNEPGVSGQARKTLSAKPLVSTSRLVSDIHDETKEAAGNSETQGTNEKPQQQTSVERPKVTPNKNGENKAPITGKSETQKTIEKTHNVDPNETTKLTHPNSETPQKKDITPEKKSEKKHPQDTLKTCAECQSALAEALKKTSKKSELEAIYAKVQELCKGTFTTQTLVEHVKQHIDTRKAQIFASECPAKSDLSELMILQSNLRKLDSTYKPEETLEQEFCDHFGSRFTVPFGKLEANPEIVDGKDCALDAQKYFHAARTFGKNNHPSYSHEDLKEYVTAKVKELLTPLNADVMKYIKILRYLNPESPYAFPDCNDLAALQNKMAERKTAAESINITNGPLRVDFVKKLDEDQIEVLIDRCSKLLAVPLANARDDFTPDRHALRSNKSLLELVKFVRGMDETAQAWMNSGFHIRKSTDFQTFANKQLTAADRSKLTKAMNLAYFYHFYLCPCLNCHGLSSDKEMHYMEEGLAKFLEEAFKSTDETVLHTVMDYTSVDKVESVDGFVTFFDVHKDLGQLMSECFRCVAKDTTAAIYRLVVAQLQERTIPKAVPGVNMNAPKDAKELFKRVKEKGKLNPVLNIAKNRNDIIAARNDLLPEGDKENNDEFDSIYRSVAILDYLEEKKYNADDFQQMLNNYKRTLGIPDIRTALDNIESYKDTQRDFYEFLKSNQCILTYSLHGFDSDYAIQDVIQGIKLSKELSKQTDLYRNVSKTVYIFGKESDGCVLQADGTISCENKFIENKLHELERDATKEEHVLFVQFLSEARKLHSVGNVRNLANRFLIAEQTDCRAKYQQLALRYGNSGHMLSSFSYHA